jgi:glycosyltransferase involved in cell wall biosynthesis
VRFTFCGEGPDAHYLRAQFATDERVAISRFPAEDSIAIHLEHDIAVIPSLGSEGTSLALCEAMAAGCAVVATAIGGMTNLILSDYNGLLIMPRVSDLTGALERLIRDQALRRQLGRRAHEVSQAAFGIARWKSAWRQVLLEVVRAPI